MKKTEKINDTVLKAVEKIARHEVEKNYFDWPPDCMGFFHQPKKTKECEKRKQQLIRAAGEVLRYSARTSLSVAVRISKTEFKQNGFERDIARCSISFCYKK